MTTRNRIRNGFTLIELMIIVAVVGVLSVLAIYSVREYITYAKNAEAKNSLGAIGRGAVNAFERESISSGVLSVGSNASITRRLCLSATATVPSNKDAIKGKKYQSNPSKTTDWNKDATLAGGGGFACLNFEMTTPQYYMYDYDSDAKYQANPSVNDDKPGTVMTATAQGDLNGDGTLSTFQLKGAVTNGRLRLAPSITEISPEE